MPIDIDKRLLKYTEEELQAELDRRRDSRKKQAVDALNSCSQDEAIEAIGACVHGLRLTAMRNLTGGR